MRPAQNAEFPIGLTATSTNPRYSGKITFPSLYGFLLIRIESKNSSASDLETIRAYQAQLAIAPVWRDPDPFLARGPALTTELLNGSLPGSADATKDLSVTVLRTTFPSLAAVKRVLSLTARLWPNTLPLPQESRINITQNLFLAGIFPNGTYNPPASVNLAEAESMVSDGILQDLVEPQNLQRLGNNWTIFSREISGAFGADFAARAYIDFNDLAELSLYIALYPEYYGENFNGVFEIAANESTTFIFSRKPPVTAFWSVTV